MGGSQLDKIDIFNIRGLGSWVDGPSGDDDADDEQSVKANSDSLHEQAPEIPVRSWFLNNQMEPTPWESSLPSLTQQDTASTISGTLDSGTSNSHQDNRAVSRSSCSILNSEAEGMRKQATMVPCDMASESRSDSLSSDSIWSDSISLGLRDRQFQTFSPSPSTDSSTGASGESVDSQVSSPITEASLELDESESRSDWDVQSNFSPPLPAGPSSISSDEIPYERPPVDHGSPTDSDGSDRESAHPTPEEENQNETVSSRPKMKRTLAGQSGDHEKDHDGLSGNQVKRVKTGDSEDQEDRILACPYYKMDPIRHRKCHRYVLKKISYVKQHLFRYHEQPVHCPRCMIEFKNDQEFFDHIRALSCEERPVSERPEGMTTNQMKQLRGTRANQKQTESEQWYEIFAILFPDAERPTSPYVNKEHSEDMSSYIEFMDREGGNIVRERLRDQLTLSDIDDETVRRAINDAVQQIYRAYSEDVAKNITTNPKDAKNEVQAQRSDKSGIQSTSGPRKHDQGKSDATSHKTGSKEGNQSTISNKEADSAKGIRTSDEPKDRGTRVDGGQGRKAEAMSWEQSQPEGTATSSVNVLPNHGNGLELSP